MRVYLDHNATTPLRAEARTAMIAAMDLPGNPSWSMLRAVRPRLWLNARGCRWRGLWVVIRSM